MKEAQALFEQAMKHIYGDGVPEDNELAVKLLTADHLTSVEGMRRAGSTTIWEYWPEEGHP